MFLSIHLFILILYDINSTKGMILKFGLKKCMFINFINLTLFIKILKFLAKFNYFIILVVSLFQDC